MVGVLISIWSVVGGSWSVACGRWFCNTPSPRGDVYQFFFSNEFYVGPNGLQ